MRIDSTRVSVMMKPPANMETADNLSLAAADKPVDSIADSASQSRPLKQTVVEKGIKALESELDKLAIDEQNEEIKVLKEKLASLSNTLSNKDYESLQEDGWSLNDSEIKTIVTVVDKIKMTLMKAGVDVSGWGDDLSKEQLEAMGESEAAQIKQALRKADLPETKENEDDFQKTLEQAESLKPCDLGTIKYLLQNELEPTIANIYKAQHSGSQEHSAPEPKLDENIEIQLEERIVSAGLQVDEMTMAYGSQLIANDIPITEENLRYMDALSKLELPIPQADVLTQMAAAVQEGGRPQDAVLLEEFTLRYRAEMAKEAVDEAGDQELEYLVAEEMDLTIENLKNAKGRRVADLPVDEGKLSLITARRQLEEIRLFMTAEANYKLLRQGISIETQPLEELVQELKNVEDDYYHTLLSQNDITATESNIDILKESLVKTDSIRQVPAYVLGIKQDVTIDTLHENGLMLKNAMDKAGQAYETLMTAPRADMGDSIKKAFQNVDDILADLNLETSPANQRAVRILAYNSLDINPDAIMQMKAVDQKVQLLFDNLTPPVVMELMKKGVNPLNMDVAELNNAAAKIKSELNVNDEEKFSKYLWKLEQKNEVSPEERTAFIGMYRMLHQVEQTDGAVIGALVNQGADITIKNLMTAVRNKKAAGMDISLDDNTPLPTGYTKSEPSITEQIEAAYQADCAREAFHMISPENAEKIIAEDNWEEASPEQLLWKFKEAQEATEHEEEYNNYQLKEFAQTKDVEDSVLRMLTEFELPVTTYNILAANKMMNKRSQVFNQLFDADMNADDANLQEVKEKLLEDFAEALKTPEEMAKAQEALADTAENVMKKMMESEHAESLDIRNLKILRQEIVISTKMAKEENYTIPVVVAGGTTSVSLKIVRGSKDKGKIDIFFETEKLGKVSAQLKIQGNKVSGIIASDTETTLERMKERESELISHLNLEESYDAEMSYIHSDSQLLHPEMDGVKTRQPDSEVNKVQTQTLYSVSKSFVTLLMGL